jgi:hypothetical protein
MFMTLNFTFVLTWHVFACMWVMIGRQEDHDHSVGWVEKELKVYTDKGMDKGLHHLALWASAFYFVVTTSTTVGYGDYFATTLQERAFCLILQFVGICVFSTLQDQMRKYEFVTSLEVIVSERVLDIK